jgi:hypothetical protein
MANKMQVAPAGIAMYPRLTSPDTKFDVRGFYGTKVRMSPTPEVEAFIAMLDAAADAAQRDAEAERKASKKPGKAIKLADKSWYRDEDSGEYVVNFKMLASGKTKAGKEFTQKPALFDAKGTPLPADVMIGGGSLLKVAYEMNPFVAPIGAGVSLRLKAAQILDLKEYGQASADSYGFGQEDGFEAPAATSFPTSDDSNESSEETTSEETDSPDF